MFFFKSYPYIRNGMKFFGFLGTILILCSLSPLAAYNTDNYYPDTTTVLVGAEYGYPPYSIVNENGEADGFSVELIKASLAAMGLETEFITGSWAEVKEYPLNGTVQSLPLVGRTPERENDYDFTFPYLTMHGTILVHEDETTIKGLKDLAGRKIAVMAGDNSEEFSRRAQLNAEIITTKTFEEALTGLSAGLYDAVIIQKLLAYQLINQLGIDNLKTAGQPLSAFSQDFCFAVQKGDDKLLAVLNEGLSLVFADGTFSKLYTKWFGPIETNFRNIDRIIVGGDTNYPPYEFLDENGQPTGYNVELTRAIAEHMGLSIEIVLAPWVETLKGLEEQTIDIIQGIFYSVDRDNYIDFTQPHTVINHVIITRSSEPGVKTLEDLAESKIIVMQGDIMQDVAEKYGYANQLVLAATQEDVLMLLSEGVGDCALVAQIPAMYWIEKNKLKNLTVGSTAILTPEYCFGTLESNNDTLMLFSEGLAALKSSGEYRDIYNKWLGVYERENIDFWSVFRMILFIVVPLLILGTASFLWSWILRRQVNKQTRELYTQKILLEQITKTSPVGITVLDSSGKFSFTNPAAEHILGLPDEILCTYYYNDPRWGILTLDGHPVADEKQPFFRAMHKDEDVYGIQQWITRKDGSRRLLLINSSPLRAADKTTNGVVSTLNDITEQYFTELAVQQEKERLTVTLQSILDGVITVDTGGTILLMNKVAEKLTGWAAVEAIGRPLNLILITEQQNGKKVPENTVEQDFSFGTGIKAGSQVIITSRDGINRTISQTASPVKDADGKIVGVVMVFHDQTEEQKLLDYIQRNAKLDSLALLAGGIAHDFNNLLGGLFGYIEMAKSVCDDAEEVVKYLDESMKAFNRAKDLTLQLLTFSKGGAPIRKIGSLKTIIQNSTTFTLSGSNCYCEHKLSDALWLCEFDENQIGQVLDNMIINAQQSMPGGGGIVISAQNIHIDQSMPFALEPGDYIHLSITDAGEGISDSHIKQIFDPFFTTKAKGHGLGLATCYSIIKRHGGLIDVESKPGKGTTFHIYLPRADAEAADITDIEHSADHTGSGIIVVMDDEAIIRDVASRMIRNMGYEVVEVKNGAEVFEACDKFYAAGNLSKVKAALFDLTIPGGMGGKETVLQCRQKFPDLPIFASSGYSSDPIMADPESFGFTASISKPYRLKELQVLFSKYIK